MKVKTTSTFIVKSEGICFYVVADNIGEAIMIMATHRPTSEIQEIKKLDLCTLAKKDD